MSTEVLSTAGAVKIVITGEGANFSAVVADANRQLDTLGAKGKQAGHTTVSSIQAASGAIRLMEGDITRNVRAVERFISSIPGMGSALQAIFPLVGAAAFGGLLYRLGSQVYDFAKQVLDASGNINKSFADLHTSSRLANDELDATNDKLKIQIAQLTGERPNRLKLMIDEARVSADKLAHVLMETGKQLDDMLGKKENQVGALGGILLGKAPTSDAARLVSDQAQQLRDIGDKYAEMMDKAKTTGDADSVRAAERKELLGTELKQLRDLEAQWNKLNALQAQPGIISMFGPIPKTDYSAQMGIIGGRAHQIMDMIRSQREAFENEGLTATVQRLQGDREVSAEQMRKWGEELEAQKAAHSMSLEDEQHYWEQKAAGIAKGSRLYTSALMEANKASVAMQRQLMSAFISGSISESRDATRGAVSPLSNELNDQYSESMQRDLEAQRRAQEAAVEAFKEMTQQLKANEAIEEERIKLATSTGGLSRLDAAHALQAIHKGMFAQWGNNAAAFSSQFPFAGVPGAADMLRQYGMQSQQDRAAVEAATALGQLRDSVNATVQKFTDVGAQLSKIFEQSLGTVNDAIIKSMVEPHARGTWSQAGKSIFSGVAKSGLELAEGSLMKAFGFHGKADGYHVWMDNFGGAGAAASAATSAAGAGGIKGFIGSMLGALPSFASGGYTPAGPILVGERGPEIWNFASAGHVTPNHRLGGQGGDVHHHWNMNVDARGAHDPAAVGAQINRAMERWKPKIISEALAADRELQGRLTRSDRW